MPTPLYDVSGHPLLSPGAAALGRDELAEHNLLAEDLLSLAGTTFADEDAARATRAVALQVNYQVEQGVDAAVYDVTMVGSRMLNYRDGIVHPIALELATLLINSTVSATTTAWPAITSLR